MIIQLAVTVRIVRFVRILVTRRMGGALVAFGLLGVWFPRHAALHAALPIVSPPAFPLLLGLFRRVRDGGGVAEICGERSEKE